jgi:inorganic phosphate transporter, PiT family
MASAWLFTLPCSAIVGAGAYYLAHAIHGSPGVIVLLIVLVAIASVIYWRSRGNKVDHNNVNDEWTGSDAPAEPEPATAA